MARAARVLWAGLATPGLLWLVALYLVPLGFVVAGSLATSDVVGRPIYGWHTENYDQVFQGLLLPVLQRSLLFALVTTAICLLVGYPTAYLISRYGGRWRNALVLLILVPWLADYLIRIYAWQQLLSEHGPINRLLDALGLVGPEGLSMLNTTFAVIVGLVYNFLPLMILPIYVAVEQLDKRLIEAGRDLYGSARSVFLHVTLPNTMSGVASGVLLVFLLALGDWATVSLLGGTDQYMIGNLIQDQLNSAGSLPFGSALTVVLLAVIALVVALGRLLASRGMRRMAA